MSTWPTALALILSLEGGCVDQPDDPGGATCYGITQATYNAWQRSRGLPERAVTEITRDEVETIYWELYWVPAEAPKWVERGHPGIALYLFDAAVNHGVAGMRRLANPVTLKLRDYPLLGLALLHAKRMEYYASLPHWDTFGRGWTRRIAEVYRKAVNLEHPNGRLLVSRLNLNGIEWDVGIARIVRERLWVRGSRVAPPCPWWRRIWGRCVDNA